MPIYAYKCESCGHRQDVLQKISDPLLTVCPACGASTFAKQVTAAGFQLKGSGWYVTDFRDNGSKKGGAAADKDGDQGADKPADRPAEAGADKAAAAGPAAADSSSGTTAAPAPTPAAGPPPPASS
ncbi:MAG: FmdB family zinc ribbon protein [Betaproteobacteria bacterium]|jgi:putative FmdB family regulatory protein